MRSSIFSTIAATMIAGSLVSCTPPDPDEEKPTEPVQAAAPSEPTFEEPTNPTDGWRTLKSDTDLPTDAQLADGADTSIGTGNLHGETNTNPSTSIKPPPSEQEDRLDSTE